MGAPSGVTGPINLGNPGEFQVRELAEMVIEMTGSKSGIVFKDLPVDDPTQRKPDISRATQQLGWQPKVNLREGLERTIAYFEWKLSGGVKSTLGVQSSRTAYTHLPTPAVGLPVQEAVPIGP
jgi:UDP-glucuronate decarboxylase